MEQCKIISVANLKGGVCKTATTVNLAASLAHVHGRRVLIVDMDPQGNATRSAVGGRSIPESLTMRQVLVADPVRPVNIEDIFMETDIPGLTVAPADLSLSEADYKLVSRPGRELVLKEALRTVLQSFDYVIIDSPPSLGILTLNALTASQGVIVPCETGFLSIEGLHYVLDVLKLAQAKRNPDLRLLGVLPTKFLILSTANREALEYLRSMKQVHVFTSVIPRDVRAEEAPSHGKPLILYAPESRATKQYLQLTEEVIALCRRD